VVLFVFLIVFGFVTYATLSKVLHDNYDRSLLGLATSRAALLMRSTMEGMSIHQVLSSEHAPGEMSPFGEMMQIVDKKGEILSKSFVLRDESLPVSRSKIEDALKRSAVTWQTVKMFDRESYRIIYFPLNTRSGDEMILMVGASIENLMGVLRKIAWILSSLLVTALIVTSSSGYVMAWRALRPVDQITSTARTISQSNLDRRLDYSAVDDELGRLINVLNDMFARLEVSFRTQRRFTADASHELRSPLTALRGEIEIALRRKRTEPEYRSVLVSALESIDRMTALLDNLLTLARADHGGLELQYRQCSLDEVVHKTVESMRPMFEQQALEVKMDIAPIRKFAADCNWLRQVVRNLLDNALKYSVPGGKVDIKLSQEGDNAVILVKDTGIGIPEEDLPHIFERFYRVDKGRSRKMGGTGLGLSICEEVVRMHGGTIKVSSSKDITGTEFIIKVPLKPLEDAEILEIEDLSALPSHSAEL
jgi:heavy metal sensor kinase